MSILYSENPDKQRTRHSRNRPSKSGLPLFAAFRGLKFWQFLFPDRDPSRETELIEPTGKIRMVSSRWIDRTPKSTD